MITSPTGRVYVGSALDFIERIKHYKRYSCKNQTKLYNSLIKYGWESHIFEIVWEGDVSEMYKYETLIGWKFDVLSQENLNCRLPKLGDIYSCVSQETRDKIGASKKDNKNFLGKKHSEEAKEKMRKPKSKEAIDKMIESKKNISKETRDKMSNWQIGRKMPKESVEKSVKARKKPVIQMDLNEEFIKEWDCAKTASKELKTSSSSITACCKKRLKTAGKFKWKYKNN